MEFPEGDHFANRLIGERDREPGTPVDYRIRATSLDVHCERDSILSARALPEIEHCGLQTRLRNGLPSNVCDRSCGSLAYSVNVPSAFIIQYPDRTA